MKKNIFLCLALFIFGCAQKNDAEVPNDISSLEEKAQLTEYLDEMQNLLIQEGDNTNLSRLPLIVSDTLPQSVAGKCIDSKVIVINKSLFSEDDLDPQLKQISTLWAVLAHEIGHCYFGRPHAVKDIYPPVGFVFKTQFNVSMGEGYPCFPLYREVWRGTLMYEDHQILMVPVEMKKYYIRELIGKVPSPTFNDLLVTDKVEIVDKSQVPPEGTSIEAGTCN